MNAARSTSLRTALSHSARSSWPKGKAECAAGFLALLCAVALAGCLPALRVAGRSVPLERGTPFSDDQLARDLRMQLVERYPASFSEFQRGILTVGGSQYVLLGHLAVCKPGQLRMIASGDLGGTAFDLLQTPDRNVHILRSAPDLEESWLKSGAMKDAWVICLAVPHEAATLVRYGQDRVALTEDRDGTREEFRFEMPSRRLAEYVLLKCDRPVYRCRFLRDAQFPPLPHPLPAVVEITDSMANYRIRVEVLQMKEAVLPPRVFEVRP